MFTDWNDRCIAERAWAETIELMAEWGISPDYDSLTKQYEIDIIEVGLPVVIVQDDLGSSEPF